MTAPDPAREYAAVLAEHSRDRGTCSCGHEYGAARGARARWQAHVTAALLASPAHAAVIAAAKARGAENALFEAADDIRAGRAGLGLDELAETLEARAFSYRAEQVTP